MKWYKNNPDDKIWWLDDPMTIGKLVFSFDKKTEFSMFKDYPQALTSEQKLKKIHSGRTSSGIEQSNL